jgi:phage-related protein
MAATPETWLERGRRPAALDRLSLKWDIALCALSWQTAKGRSTGILELVESNDSNAYRAVLAVRFAEAVYVLHAFQKKSPSGVRTARHDVDLVSQRLRRAQQDYEERHGKATR